MSFNGSGTFVINSSGQPVIANTVVSTTVFNALTADLATGLSTCITKDGQTTPTANIPMGTFKLTNLGVGSAATDSATLGQVQASTTKLVTVSGTDTITGTLTPALTAYTAGQMFYFVAGGANTGAVTLNIDGLGSRNMTRHGSVALVAGDILSGEVCVVVYDGTRFQLLNPASYTNLNVTGVLALAAGTALLPSLAFTGDLNTGLWSPAADMIAASTGGSERLRVDSSGNLGIGTAGLTARGNFDLSTGNAVGSQTRSIHLGYSAADFYGYRLTNVNDAGSFAAGTFSIQRGTTAAWVDDVVIDNNGNLGIGTASPSRKLTVNGTSNLGGSVNSVLITDGTFSVGVASITAESGARLDIGTAGANGVHFWANNVERLRIESNGSLYAGRQLALATTATDGFLYVPTCAGVPTGTPTAVSGMAPIVVDTTNNRWYFYSGGAWRNAGP